MTVLTSQTLLHSSNAREWLSDKRRALLVAGGAWPILTCAGAVLAQSKKPPVLIGWLAGGSRASGGRNLSAFKEELAALGWKEGVHYTLEERWAEGDQAVRLALAKELSVKNPSIIVTSPSRFTAAAAKAAPTIPVVQANGASPVNRGLAKSLARPGGMVTGLTNLTGSRNETVIEKYLEMLLLAVPKIRRVGFLLDGGISTDGAEKVFQRVAAQYKVESRFSVVAKVEEFERAFAYMHSEKIEGLVLQASALFTGERQRIVDRALKERWPLIAGPDEFADSGALLTYGVNRDDLHRRAAHYVDKILKGAKPGDLPIEQPMRIELVINHKTAKILGLKLAPELVGRADKVIE